MLGKTRVAGGRDESPAVDDDSQSYDALSQRRRTNCREADRRSCERPAAVARRVEAWGCWRSGAAESRSRGWPLLRATVLPVACRRVGSMVLPPSEPERRELDRESSLLPVFSALAVLASEFGERKRGGFRFLAPRTRPVRHRPAGRYRSRRLLLARAATTRRRRAWNGQVGRKSCPPAPPIAAMCWAACRRARSRLRGAVCDPPRRSNQPRSGLLCQFLAGRRRRDMDHSGVLIASRLLAPVVRRAGKTHVFALGGLLFGSNVPEHRLNVVVEPGGVWPSFGNPGATGRGGARGACDTARFLVEDGWVTDAQVRRLREKRMAGKMLAAGR